MKTASIEYMTDRIFALRKLLELNVINHEEYEAITVNIRDVIRAGLKLKPLGSKRIVPSGIYPPVNAVSKQVDGKQWLEGDKY